MLSRFSRLVAASSPRGTHPTTASRRPLFILNGRLSSIAGGAAATPPTRDDYAALSTGFSQPRAGLSSAAASAGVSHRTAFPPVAGLEKQQSPAELLKTPPMEEEDPGPKIREMRVQFRPVVEQGSRGARRLRKAGKVPGVLYSSNTCSAKGSTGEKVCVKVDKVVLDREIRRLNAAFDNTVYELVVEGARPSEDNEEIQISTSTSTSTSTAGEGGEGGKEAESGAEAAAALPVQKELVIANESRLHPVFRTILSVNWIRYKAGRKYPIPIKFINNDLNDNFKKGAYIRRMKTHQHIFLPENPEEVPKWLYLDLEFVRSGSKLRVSDVIIPEGIRFFRDNEPAMWNEIVCTIKGRKLFASEDDDEE